MIHQPLGGTRGQATDIEIHAKRILKMKDTLNQILSERTGQPLEKFKWILSVITSCHQLKLKNMV